MTEHYKGYRHDRPLLERLRDHHNLNTPHSNAMQEAADEIERLRAENEKLREALKNCIAALRHAYFHGFTELYKTTADAAAAALWESGDE